MWFQSLIVLILFKFKTRPNISGILVLNDSMFYSKRHQQSPNMHSSYFMHTDSYCTHAYTILYPSHPSIHHSMDSCLLVSNARLTLHFHYVRSCAILLRECMSIWNHSLMSSNHSLFGLPLRVSPSMIPNNTPFTSRLSSIQQICPNRLSFLSMMSCTMFLVFPTRLRTSTFVIFWCQWMCKILL